MCVILRTVVSATMWLGRCSMTARDASSRPLLASRVVLSAALSLFVITGCDSVRSYECPVLVYVTAQDAHEPVAGAVVRAVAGPPRSDSCDPRLRLGDAPAAQSNYLGHAQVSVRLHTIRGGLFALVHDDPQLECAPGFVEITRDTSTDLFEVTFSPGQEFRGEHFDLQIAQVGRAAER